jgi:hypothetical protein
VVSNAEILVNNQLGSRRREQSWPNWFSYSDIFLEIMRKATLNLSHYSLSQYRDWKPVAAERQAECVKWRLRFFVSNVLELVNWCPAVFCARLA